MRKVGFILIAVLTIVLCACSGSDKNEQATSDEIGNQKQEQTIETESSLYDGNAIHDDNGYSNTETGYADDSTNKLIGKWKPVGMEDYPDAIEFLSDGTMIFLGEDAAGSDGPIEKGTYYMEEGILYVVLPWDDEVSVCEYKFLDNQYQYLDLKFESGMGTSPISFYRVD